MSSIVARGNGSWSWCFGRERLESGESQTVIYMSTETGLADKSGVDKLGGGVDVPPPSVYEVVDFVILQSCLMVLFESL